MMGALAGNTGYLPFDRMQGYEAAATELDSGLGLQVLCVTVDYAFIALNDTDAGFAESLWLAKLLR